MIELKCSYIGELIRNRERNLRCVENMNQIATFILDLETSPLSKIRGSEKRIPVEILVDYENTYVILDCGCCPELLASRLPGGVLIPIASSFKTFFEKHNMRNVAVDVDGNKMTRTYRGNIEAEEVDSLRESVQTAIFDFMKKRKKAN
ncbi:MAG: hypothetical protein BAJATHORv1_40019 [Candidatus Thorarchaeota archaeon]|nr:MAG: hypothetical protein BAJATHORv1_40019 [Candidatus Thorarchaeota archaeon]